MLKGAENADRPNLSCLGMVWPVCRGPTCGEGSSNLTTAPLNRQPGPLTRSRYLTLPDTPLSKEYKPKPA